MKTLCNLTIPDDQYFTLAAAMDADANALPESIRHVALGTIIRQWPTVLALAREQEKQLTQLRNTWAIRNLKRSGKGRPAVACPIPVDELGTANDQVLARKYKTQASYVRRWRVLYGIPRFRGLTDKMLEANNWDWNQKDADLAREHGITRERVRQIRQRLGLPPTYERRQRVNYVREQEFLDWVKVNHLPERPTHFQQREAEHMGFHPVALKKWAKKNKLVCVRERTKKNRRCSIFSLMNWELPNWMLEVAWHTTFNSVANYRSRFGLPPSPYIKRIEVPEQYQVLFECEKKKAEAWREGKLMKYEGRIEPGMKEIKV